MTTATGLCACGCGGKTKIASQTAAKYGWVKGEPYRFIRGHSRTKQAGWASSTFPVRNKRRVHIARAEQALGKSLPPRVVVHHVTGMRGLTDQLVICEDQAYHMLLHMRARIKAAGGNPNLDRICHYCHQLKSIDQFIRHRSGKNHWHCLECNRELCKARYHRGRPN